jgi:hypothetical protein
MTNYAIYGDSCTKCEWNFYRLIEALISDIHHLESKAIYLRHLLSSYLPENDREMLRYEIFSDLTGSLLHHSAYQRYVSEYCAGIDPLDNMERFDFLKKVSQGEEPVGL